MEKNAVNITIKSTKVGVRGLYKLKKAIKSDFEAFTSLSPINCTTEWNNYYVICHVNNLFDFSDIYDDETANERLESERVAEYTLERYYGDMVVCITLTLGYSHNELIITNLNVDTVMYAGSHMLTLD